MDGQRIVPRSGVSGGLVGSGIESDIEALLIDLNGRLWTASDPDHDLPYWNSGPNWSSTMWFWKSSVAKYVESAPWPF